MGLKFENPFVIGKLKIFCFFCLLYLSSGYISPEYMMHGQFSMKSDVYSFGVLVLEIISGKRNSNFHEIDDSGKNLVTHVSTKTQTFKR